MYHQFTEACRGIADACRAFGTPVTGGNVSFYNESPLGAIDPTPTVGMVGLLRRAAVEVHADEVLSSPLAMVEEAFRREQRPARAIGVHEERAALFQTIEVEPADRPVAKHRDGGPRLGRDRERPDRARRRRGGKGAALPVVEPQMRVGAKQDRIARDGGGSCHLAAAERQRAIVQLRAGAVAPVGHGEAAGRERRGRDRRA